ncbi:PREDICTED: uncharacterized protein LOC18587541 isoform X4 [Theobroma cacao]|nr:PREDICTED: uncharacterized protein LOC18587541 isoform X4 [Theobroma cacao]
MEKLRCLVPESVKRRVAESTADDLPSVSSSLVHLFLSLPEFHQVIGDLADPGPNPKRKAGLCCKNKEAALDLKQKGNQCYSTGDYSQALRCYSQKMDLPMESLRDCSRALQISPCYPK